MKFRNRDDTIDLGRHWHLDCRLTAELPEDNVVRARFLANAIFGAVTLGMLLLTLWLGYANANVAASIAGWEKNLADNRTDIDELRKIERDLNTLGRRIHDANQLAGAPFLASDLWMQLGRTRPAQMQIETITMTKGSVLLHGGFAESSERASRMLGRYVETLRSDPVVGPLCESIVLTNLTRMEGTDESLTFDITLHLR